MDRVGRAKSLRVRTLAGVRGEVGTVGVHTREGATGLVACGLLDPLAEEPSAHDLERLLLADRLPDGLLATEEVLDPSSRLGLSNVYVVPAAGGTPRKIVDGDGVQPSFSPSGDRIVYWSNNGGQRDIFVIPAKGGSTIAVIM